MDCRIRVVDEWTGVCLSCEGRRALVLLERGRRWTARELFARTWTPQREFAVACRACGGCFSVSRHELTAAAAGKRPAAVDAGPPALLRTPAPGKTSAPSSPPARLAPASRLRPRIPALPVPRSATDDANGPPQDLAAAGPRPQA